MDSEDERELDKLKKDKRKAERKGNLKEVAKCCNVIGEILAKYGHYEDAVTEHETERGLSEALQDTLGLAIAHRKIGECYCQMGQFTEALKQHEKYLTFARSCKNDIEEQRAWATIGHTHLQESEASPDKQASSTASQKAEDAFVRGLEVTERLKSSLAIKDYIQMKTRLLLNLGLLYDGRGNTERSAEFIKQAIQKAQQYSLWDDLHRCQFSLAGIYQRAKQMMTALQALEAAQKCAKKLKDKQLEGETLVQKALCHIQLGDLYHAKRSLKMSKHLGLTSTHEMARVKRLYKSVQKMEEVEADLSSMRGPEHLSERLKLHEQMGDCAASIACYQLAIKHYLNMLSCAQELHLSSAALIPIYVSLAQTYVDDKNYEKALEFYRKELERRHGDLEQECRTWLNIAEAEELHGISYKDISQSYCKAFECAGKAKHRQLQARALKSLLVTQATFNQQNHKQQTAVKLKHLMEKYSILSDDDDDTQVESSDATSQEEDEDDNGVISDLSDQEDSSDTEDTSSSRPHPVATVTTAGATSTVVARKRSVAWNKRNEKGETPLHRACIEGNTRKVKTLLEQGHPVNPRDYCGWIPLHEASNLDHSDIVELLIVHGAWVNDRGGNKCGGVTPLHDAAAAGSLGCIEILIEKGAIVIAKDEHGETALDCLTSWRERCIDDLDSSTLSYCSTVEKLLRKKMAEKGYHFSSALNSSLRRSMGSAESDLPSISSLSTSRTTRKKNRSGTGATRVMPDLERMEYENGGDDDDDDDDHDHDADNDRLLPPPSFISTSTECDKSANKTATDTYKHAIASVGNSAARRLVSQSANQPDLDPSSEAAKPSLLFEDDFVNDDWLIDDMRPTKRKRLDVGDFFSTNSTRKSGDSVIKRKVMRTTGQNSEQENTRSNNSNNNNDPFASDELSGVFDSYLSDDVTDNVIIGEDSSVSSEDDLIETGISFVDRHRLSNAGSHLPSRPRQKHKRQLKLTTMRMTPRNYSDPVESDSNLMSDSSGPSNSNQVSQAPTLLNSGPAAIMRVKVRVKDKLLLIPIPTGVDSHTIIWLSQETSHRYYNLYGVKPILTLSTKDGAILSPDDVITDVLSANEEVEAIVESWDLPPLADRYKQACKAVSAVSYRNIATALDKGQQSGQLILENLSLKPVQLQPIFRALQCQYNLKHLYLSGNKLTDVGIESLSKCFDTLPNLSMLDVSCNQLTALSVKYLSEAAKRSSHGAGIPGQSASKPLETLSSLTLSHNDLGDGWILDLIHLIQSVQSLHQLKLSSCQITGSFFQHHRVALAQALAESRLASLDVSCNNLGSTGSELLLRSLNVEKVNTLNLSSTVGPTCGLALCRNLESYFSKAGCVLEELNLQDCHLTADCEANLARMVIQGKKLGRLSLSVNSKLGIEASMCMLKESMKADTPLEALYLRTCGIRSPVSTEFLDILSEKMHSMHPLHTLELTCLKLESIDRDSLFDIWRSKWADDSVCVCEGDLIKLAITHV